MKDIWKNRKREKAEDKIYREKQNMLESMLRSNASMSLYLDESKVNETKNDIRDEDDEFYNMILKHDNEELNNTETERVIQDLTADDVTNKHNNLSKDYIE
jgi:hypothetical protein